MNRRLLGSLVLCSAVLAAVVVPAAAGRAVGGSPTAQAIPGPPSVGSCVRSVSALPPTPDIAANDAPVTYPTADHINCAGPIIGEVMSVDLTPKALGEATVASYQLAGSDCELSEVNYVGSIGPFDPTTITTPGIAWQAAVTVQSVAIGPTAVQRAAGQTWTACIGTAPDETPYRGRIEDALSAGDLPPTFATCRRSLTPEIGAQVDDQQVPCAAPHLVEVLALTQIADPATTTSQVQKSCLGMASRTLRSPDPTRGGRLSIAVYTMDTVPVARLTSATMFQGDVGCLAFVQSPNRLVGTLIGIAAKPLPVTR